MASTCIIDSTVASYPQHPYETIKNDILGKRYTIHLTFVGPYRARTLNQTYRQKSYSPNVLSFPLDATVGEIYICPQVAKREAKRYNLSPEGYVAYLYIHGLLHLKGLDHGEEMERYEARYVRKYDIT